MRIEAATMKDAFQKAANELNCSLTDIHVKEVIQHPSGGFLGFFKKNAIIEVVSEKESIQKHQRDRNERRERSETKKEMSENSEKKEHKKQNLNESKRDSEKQRDENRKKRKKNHCDKNKNEATKGEHLQKAQKNIISDPFVDTTAETQTKPEYVIKRTDETIKEVSKKTEIKNILDTSIIENFNQEFSDNDKITEQKEQGENKEKTPIDFDVVIPEIKDGLTRLFGASCFEINKIEVSKFNDECVLIELDGEDAALLIGKEGYRYKAISYLIHNWLNSKYNLAIRLEIAEFLKNQELMMDQYLSGIIERVQNNGRAQTKPLDGVLVKIALAKLREKFPDKYVGIKSNGNDKFVVVNEFFKK